METQEKFAIKLDNTLLTVISRGVMKDLEIIKKYHMDEVRNIRDYMMCFVDATSGPYQLNQCFHSALSELNINLMDLLMPIEKKVVVNKVKSKSIVM